jgi:hypothetical protein
MSSNYNASNKNVKLLIRNCSQAFRISHYMKTKTKLISFSAFLRWWVSVGNFCVIPRNDWENDNGVEIQR